MYIYIYIYIHPAARLGGQEQGGDLNEDAAG